MVEAVSDVSDGLRLACSGFYCGIESAEGTETYDMPFQQLDGSSPIQHRLPILNHPLPSRIELLGPLGVREGLQRRLREPCPDFTLPRLLGLQLVDEGHELVHASDDAFLFGEGWKRN